MKKAILAVIGLALFLAAKVYAYDDGDFQIWNTDVEELKVNKDSKVAFEEEFRWGNNASEFYYQHYDVGYFYNLEKWLNIGGGYRHIYELKRGKFKLENEPYVTATLFWGLEGFKVEDRSRMEYRHFDYQADSWRYRNRFTLKLPWRLTRFEFQPYVADEIFVELNDGSLSRNRLCAGLGFTLIRNLRGELYYMLQSTKGSEKWADVNILGAKLKIAF
jgi:hypothetical protein